MSNFLRHNKGRLKFSVNREDYWDFQLSNDGISGGVYGDGESCVSALIDINNPNCVWFDEIYSDNEKVWVNAVNSGVTLENFGYTSVDNGKTQYQKDRITNREFLNIYTNTHHTIKEGDKRLTLSKVGGNHGLYNYPCEIVQWEDKFFATQLNGGWYQGFFCCNDGTKYKVLPTDLGIGWTLDFTLNKSNFQNKGKTLNDVYPENKGIFFYIGTRAENKWAPELNVNISKTINGGRSISSDYVDTNYGKTNKLNNTSYVGKTEFGDVYSWAFNDEYIKPETLDRSSGIKDEYIKTDSCDKCEYYTTGEYISEDVTIDEDAPMQTSGGYDMRNPNLELLKTDNKFLTFDRTCDGQIARKWNEENTEVVLVGTKPPKIENYFLLFDRTCDGYTTKNVDEKLKEANNHYDIMKDIYRNAFALQIKDDGSIGYKFLVKDCETENNEYKILSEYSRVGVVKEDEWHNIRVKIEPIVINKLGFTNRCLILKPATEKMRVRIYVDSKLVLYSKELPILNLRRLDDLDEKQEGVPFNISLGGGTQGLAEVVYLNYMEEPIKTYPLEKEFGGSFIGYVKTFKFSAC